jgi:hypothetical protein
MNAIALLLSFLLLLAPDIPRATRLRPADSSSKQPDFSNTELPLFSPSTDWEEQDQTPSPPPGPRKSTLQPTSKLELIRYVSGEFAKAAKALPAGKEGFLLFVDKPLNQNLLDSAVATHGAAVHAGEQVQITKLDFREHTIIVDVNGGGRGKKRLMDRVHIEMGGVPTMRGSSEAQQTGPPGVQPGAGSTLYLEFNKTIPDLTPDELKKMLSPFLDFNRQRSASVQWIDTLPTDIRKAIQERVAKVGMDREMVIAAIGKPGHKVRERDSEGNDIEDWIYGTPPDRTLFVRFTGDKVTSIKQFPQ